MSQILTQFSDYAEQSRKNWQIPGMAVAIVKDDKIIYAQGFGKRDTTGSPVTANTIFDIASLTKSFTATLLAMQIDQGKYNWNTKIVTLYPQFKPYDSNTTKTFEVRDLLAHDSGLPADAVDLLTGNFGYTLNHAIYALRFIKPVAPFRTEFAYQDIFPMLAGKIIEKISGKSFIDNLHHNLFNPLQMTYSYGDEESIFQLEDIAQPFAKLAGKVYAYPINSPYSSKVRASVKDPGSSGGIHSSAMDMAKWLIFNIQNGTNGKIQLVSTKNMQVIHSPQTLIKNSEHDVNLHGEHKQNNGMGWFIDKQEYQPNTVLYHPGGGMGMHALMAYIPEEEIGIVILTNTWGNQLPEALYRRFFDLYFNKQLLKDWSYIFLQEKIDFFAKEKLIALSDKCVIRKVIETKSVINFVMLLPLHRSFHGYGRNAVPIVHPNGEVVGVQVTGYKFSFFGMQEFINILNNGSYEPKQFHPEVDNPAKFYNQLKLSPRQKEVLFLVSQGISQDYAAQILGIKRGTLSKIISDQICPKFNIFPPHYLKLLNTVKEHGIDKIIPESFWRPFIFEYPT